MVHNKYKNIVISFLIVLSLAGCVAVSHVGTETWREYFDPECSKAEITKRFNLQGGKWWNYYIRGCCYAEAGNYDEAIRDFKKSVSLRSKDELSARCYGMHFCEYFAHRELGVAYYEQKMFDEAKRELETSISTADSARAKFYLNKCNEAILKMTKTDLKPPQIKITSHADGEIINTPITRLKGVIEGEGCVNFVAVQEKRLCVELAEKHLDFSEDIQLHIGENIINLEARDLLGNSARQYLKLILDMRPPTLYFDDIKMLRTDGKSIISIKGTVVDDYGVKDMFINNKEICFSSGREVDFEQDIDAPEGHKILFKVVDMAGNVAEGEHALGEKSSLFPINMQDSPCFTNNPVRVAAGKLGGSIAGMLLASQDTEPPSVSSLPEREMDHGKDGQRLLQPGTNKDVIPPMILTSIRSGTVYDENFVFSGDVHDNGSVARLFVNEHAVDIRPGKHVFFNHVLALREGENTIVVRAIDVYGNETQLPPIRINRKSFELFEVDARYAVVLLPIKVSSGQDTPTESLYSMLLKAFDEDPRRFKFVEIEQTKVTELLKEQKRIDFAEGVLIGNVEEESKGINIMLRLVDAETNQVLANADVYDEDKSIKNLKWLTYCLSLKMRQHFPIVHGKIVQVSGNGFYIDAGSASGIKAGMKLLPFRESKDGDFVLKEPLDIVARIVQVQPDTSFARVINSKDMEKIEKSDLVITK